MGQAEQETKEEVEEGQRKSRREVWSPSGRLRTLGPGRRHLPNLPGWPAAALAQRLELPAVFGCPFSAQPP